MLVSGLGKGGKSYFALDVTDPASVTDEASAAVEGAVGIPGRRTSATRSAARTSSRRARSAAMGRHPPVGLQQRDRPRHDLRPRRGEGTLLKKMSTGVGSARQSGRARASAELRRRMPQPARRADLRRRPVRRRLALRRLGRERRQLDGCRSSRASVPRSRSRPSPQSASTPTTASTGGCSSGPETAPQDGPDRAAAEPDDVCNARRHATDARPDRRGAHQGGPEPGQRCSRPRFGCHRNEGLVRRPRPGYRIITNPVAMVGVVGYVATGPPTDPCQIGQPAQVFVRQFGNGQSLLESIGRPVETFSVARRRCGDRHRRGPQAGMREQLRPSFGPLSESRATGAGGPTRAFEVAPGINDQHRINWHALGQ